MTSEICRPIEESGFRYVIGPWKIIKMWIPRIFVLSFSGQRCDVLAIEGDGSFDNLAITRADAEN